MQPVNTKSLLAFIFNEMEKLSNKETTPQEAMAQAKLASQASNLLNYELKRTIVQIRLNEIGTGLQAQDIVLREIESKPLNDENFPKLINYQIQS